MRLNSRLVVADACQYVKKGRKVESHIMFDSVSFKQLCLDQPSHVNCGISDFHLRHFLCCSILIRGPVGGIGQKGMVVWNVRD